MNWIEKALRIGFLGAPLILLLLPADFFDEGPVVCPSRLFLGVECPGCGLTRATQHLIHGDWQIALDYNPLVLITTPILLYLWGRNALHLFKSQQRLKKLSVL
ncbi:MAG: DUF2752 domain-containing protein [Bacteroidia bacterium]|jgi:hypothetical protein|nr:DUF2752 domain-containing protein [Bacteroidia bacterium]